MVSSTSPSESSQNRATEASESGQSDFISALTDELLELRRGPGLVVGKIRRCRNLQVIAEAWKQEQPAAIARLSNAHAAIEMVKSLLEEERPIGQRDSLKLMYGLIIDDRSQAKRIGRYLDLPENEKTVFSDSTIKRHSKGMAGQLAIRLSGIMQGNAVRDREDYVGRLQSPRVEEAPSPLRVRLMERFVRFGPNRVLDDVLTIMHVEATRPGMHSRQVSQEYFSDRDRGVVELTPEFGCEIVDEQLFEEGAAHIVLGIPQQLKAGESHVFAFRAKIHSKMPAYPPAVHQAPISDMDQYNLWLQFHSDAIPEKVWKYSLEGYLEVRLAARREQERIQHNGSRFICAQWRNLKAGLSYGVAWDWGARNDVPAIDKELS